MPRQGRSAQFEGAPLRSPPPAVRRPSAHPSRGLQFVVCLALADAFVSGIFRRGACGFGLRFVPMPDDTPPVDHKGTALCWADLVLLEQFETRATNKARYGSHAIDAWSR